MLLSTFVDDAFYLFELVGGEAFQVLLAQDGVVNPVQGRRKVIRDCSMIIQKKHRIDH